MELEYKSNKLRKQCENPSLAKKEYGARIGNKLVQRVGELLAANSLLDIKCIPSARLHRLEGKRSTEYSVDLVHPFRLVFKPVLKTDKDMNKIANINIVKIEEVVDYHGKQK
ncbi:MAG: hypothetical protein COA82_03220 [Alkaliphilus sp.]|nr:MAG: hypothetical protein COA82_03220 [Alkaliphilus sp.]